MIGRNAYLLLTSLILLHSQLAFADNPGFNQAYQEGSQLHPGGSMRDQEVIDAADERGVVMLYTGTRHFRH